VPLLHDVDQYSDKWDALRLGIPTSSQFDRIITPQGKPSAQWKKYACHLVAEKLLGRPVETYTSPFMERGSMLEADAVQGYEIAKQCETARIGFITNEEKTMGCSPDRLIGDDGLLEIKVPSPVTQVQYLVMGELGRAYWPQLQGQLYISQRKWVDICSWHPELPPAIVRVERDEEYIACLDSLLFDFNTFLKEVLWKIEQMQNIKLSKGEGHVPTEIRF
jgi:hypothetical protein